MPLINSLKQTAVDERLTLASKHRPRLGALCGQPQGHAIAVKIGAVAMNLGAREQVW